MPKVSIVIPVYNKESYIEATLNSVLKQDFQDFEIIAVNDGSTDRSGEILLRMAAEDARIRVINISNGGVSNARNVGLKHASGDCIQFLDSDDKLAPGYLCAALPTAEENAADILFSSFEKVNEEMKQLEHVSIPQTGCCSQEQLCRTFIEWQYKNGFFGFISNKLFRRDLLVQSHAQFPVGTTLAEDLDFYTHLYPYVKNAYFWDGNSFFYLQTDTNYLCRAKVDYHAQIMIHLDIRAWFKQSGFYTQYQSVLDRKVAEYAFFVLFHHEECGESITEAFHFLTQKEDVLHCVHPEQFSGFTKQVLSALKHKNLQVLRILLSGRTMVRNLYRMVKKHG